LRALRPPEPLESRRLLTASTLDVEGLEFVALGGFFQSGTTYTATGTVDVGFLPGSNTFTPVLQLTGNVTVDDVADASFSANGTVSEVLTATPIPLFEGSQSFDIESLLNGGLSELDGLSFNVAGVGFDLDQILLVNSPSAGPEIELQGSLSVAGLTVAVDNSNYVDVSGSGVALTGVDATLNGSVSIGGVTFDADQLSIAYMSTGGNDIFTVTGSTSFTVANSTVQVDWGGTTPKGTQTSGLVVENGSIDSLDMSVTGSVTVDAVTFKADDLIVTYTAASSTFTMTGGADFDLEEDDANGMAQNDVSVEFGGTAGGNSTAGMVIVNGDLTRLDMTVNASFNLFGLTLSATGLVVEYQDDPTNDVDQFVMYGGLALSSASQPFDGTSGQVFDGVTATLGDKSSPGLVVTDGSVEDVNVTVNGSFNLFSLTVAPDNLNVTYTRSLSTVDINGGLKVTLAGDFEASTKLNNGGIMIDTQTGAVTIDGVTLDLSDVNLGAVTIQQFMLKFKQTPTKTKFDAALVLTFSGGWSVGASMDFVNGEVNKVTVDYMAGTSEGIELGPSGLFLTEFSTTIENIAQGVLTITGSIAVAYGPSVTINGQTVAIVSASGDFLIDSSELTLTNVDVLVADGIIGQGNGTLVADWAAGNYSLTASLQLFDGVFDLDGTVQFDSAGDFLLIADASVEVPDAVPVIGGDTVASMNFAFKYLNNGGDPTGFVAAWTTVSILGFDQSIGFEYQISGSVGSFSLLGDDGVQDVENQLNQPPAGGLYENYIQIYTGYLGGADADGVTGQVLQVPAGASTISLMIQSSTNAIGGEIFLLTPPYTLQSLTQVLGLYGEPGNLTSPQQYTFPGTNVSATYVIRQETFSTEAVLIQAPAGQTLPAGQYAILYAPSNGVPAPTATSSFIYFQPQVAAPVVAEDNTTGEATLTGTGLIASSLAGTTTVSFYATTSPTDHQGVFLGAVSQQQGGLTVGADGSFNAVFNWNPSRFQVGSYYIYAEVDDGQNPPVLSSNSTSPIVVQAMAKGLVTSGNQPVAGATVQLFYNADPNDLPPTPDQVAVTGPDGSYSFRSDEPASPSSPLNFVVNLIVPAGYQIGTPTAISASYTGGQPVTINYALEPSSGTIVGTVTQSPPDDGTTGANVPIAGVTVFLDENGNGQLDPGELSTVTDSQGAYTFLNLEPGSYNVVIQPPAGDLASASTSQIASVGDSDEASGIDFALVENDTAPASSAPVYPGGGKVYGPIVTTSISGIAFDPRGPSALSAILVSVQDLDSGLYWNGYHWVSSVMPIQLTAHGTVSWRLDLPVSSLISGDTYQVGSLALDADGYNQTSPTDQTYTYKGPSVVTPPTLASTTSIVSSQPISVPGEPVVFTITVSAGNSGAGVPTGTVWLVDGSAILAALPLHDGTASYEVGSLALGIHAIHAYYSGDTTFVAGGSATTVQTVAMAALNPGTSADPQGRTKAGSQVLDIGVPGIGNSERVVLQWTGLQHFVRVRIVQTGTGRIVYQQGFPSRWLKGIVAYVGPGTETPRIIGQLPVRVWTFRSGAISPVSTTSVREGAPFRARVPGFAAISRASARRRAMVSTRDRGAAARPGLEPTREAIAWHDAVCRSSARRISLDS
jgi:hypothetical protein